MGANYGSGHVMSRSRRFHVLWMRDHVITTAILRNKLKLKGISVFHLEMTSATPQCLIGAQLESIDFDLFGFDVERCFGKVTWPHTNQSSGTLVLLNAMLADSLETVWVVASTYLDPSTPLNDTTQSPARDSTLTNQQTTIFYKNSTATPYRPPETQTVTWLSQTVHPKRWKQFPPFSRKLGVDVLVKKMETFWCGR